MLETYYKYRMEYKDFLLFIKIGNFYEVFDKDSLILNKLFGYKIKRIKDSIKNGIDFLGYRFYINNNKIIIRIRNRTKDIFKSKVKRLKYLIEENYINIKEFNIKLSSYKGLLKYSECKNLYYKSIK